MIQKFEDIIAWQKAQDFAVEIYAAFEEHRDWDFKNQIRRAVVSISKILRKALIEVLMLTLRDFYISL